MLSSTVWLDKSPDEKVVAQFAQKCGVSKLLARLLLARKIATKEEVAKFLHPKLADLPDPNNFADMEKAVVKIASYITSHKIIGVFGDYDVDGVTSTCILTSFLQDIQTSVCYRIANRFLEGYGLSKEGIDKLYDQGARLVITVDCGVSSHSQIDYAIDKGMEVIVVDHHRMPEVYPKAYAIINPQRKDCQQNAQHLCAAGVTFNLCIALRRYLKKLGWFNDKKYVDLKNYLDFAALGTVADIVPLIKENRIIVKNGIKRINNNCRLGMKALLQQTNTNEAQITSSTLGYYIGPRINASGRLDDAGVGVQLLMENEFSKAIKLAINLEQQNLSRQNIQRDIFTEATEQIENNPIHNKAKILVVGSEKWHPGVVGIVASKLVDKYSKPTIVIGEGGKGSGRSIATFHLHQALSQVSDSLAGFGGHAHAVGVQAHPNGVEKLRNALIKYADEKLTNDDLVKQIKYDGEIEAQDISDNTIDDILQLQPFGSANAEPVFRLNKIKLTNIKILKGEHIKADLDGYNIGIIAFGIADKIDQLKGSLDILISLQYNYWQGRKNIQLRLKDFKLSY